MKKKKSGKKKIITISIVCIAIVGLIATLSLRPKAEKYNEETAKTKDIETYYSFTGNIESKDSQMIIADTMMQIKKINVEEGDVVEEDDVLFETTQGQKIKAKINGEVGEILTEEGSTLMSGTNITTITNYSDLQIKIKVDEYDIDSMIPNKEVSIFINALDKETKGKITKVSKEATTVNGVSYFTASIDVDKDSDLLVGMSTEVSMLAQRASDATSISMKVLQFDDQNQPFVYYKDNSGKVTTKEVKVGINDGNTVQILDGVKSGEVVFLPINKNVMTNSSDFRKN